MVLFNDNGQLFITSEKIKDIINENKQLIYGINSLRHLNEFKTKVNNMLSRLQKNLFFLAHLCNQPKAPRNSLDKEVSRPFVSLDYSTDNKNFVIQHKNSGRTSSLVLNPLVTQNTSQHVYFDSSCLEFRSNDIRSSEQVNLQTCDHININNSCNNSISKVNFDNITPTPSDYESTQNIGFTIGVSSPNQNFMQNQSTEHFICRYCQRKCRNQSGLTQHTMKVHPDAPEVQHLLKQAQSKTNSNPLSIVNVGTSTF
ncbi:hypothetical protein FG386_003177 [Cryptosporidium ryanae]|uniref:uncharacterized protein n=1 Tax=Cryptosporidium ryanae TaxID=515981 RepID=UPI00351A5447|nr:hypothetical protein FG386_003177 [Cryptosporidium ryanae]